MYIDTHAHLTFPEFDIDINEVIERARNAKLEAIINIALDDEAVRKSIKLAEENPDFIFNAIGTHPHEASEWKEDSYEKHRSIAQKHKIVAIGETGLDYHYKLSPVEQQQAVFRQHLQLAQELDIPAVIHSREASQDTIQILRQENKGELKGVLHCFGGDMELAEAALQMGLYISFTGNITFPKAEKIRQAARMLPIEKILIETDCPFLAPQIYRGKRNEPSFVVEIAKKIAELKNLQPEDVSVTSTDNARRLFKL